MDIKKIYRYALQREYEGKRFFIENADRLKNPVAANAFNNLAEEEKKHIEFILSLLDAMDHPEAAASLSGSELEKAGFFSQRAVSEAMDQSVFEAMVPDLPVLRMAYLIERDFAEFYESAAKNMAGSSQQALQMLARWERGHEILFKQYYDQAFEEYAQMPWGG